MLYTKNKSFVKSCQKHCFKNPLFSTQKQHCFPTCALFYPIVLKRKIITADATGDWIRELEITQWLTDIDTVYIRTRPYLTLYDSYRISRMAIVWKRMCTLEKWTWSVRLYIRSHTTWRVLSRSCWPLLRSYTAMTSVPFFFTDTLEWTVLLGSGLCWFNCIHAWLHGLPTVIKGMHVTTLFGTHFIFNHHVSLIWIKRGEHKEA